MSCREEVCHSSDWYHKAVLIEGCEGDWFLRLRRLLWVHDGDLGWSNSLHWVRNTSPWEHLAAHWVLSHMCQACTNTRTLVANAISNLI